MEVFHCEAPPDQEIPLYVGKCFANDRPEETQVCKRVLAAWAMGAPPFTYPRLVHTKNASQLCRLLFGCFAAGSRSAFRGRGLQSLRHVRSSLQQPGAQIRICGQLRDQILRFPEIETNGRRSYRTGTRIYRQNGHSSRTRVLSVDRLLRQRMHCSGKLSGVPLQVLVSLFRRVYHQKE
jgi:hypothetical protein